jgi:hypothetical protein
MKRYFTVEQANQLIPQLELRFGKVLQFRSQLRTTQEELEKLGEPPTVHSIRKTEGAPVLIRARGRFRALLEALTEELAHIEETGVSVKDLDIGLCDFLGERNGRDVCLCWQYGEKRVTHWHDLDAGFSGRQPIEEASAPSRLLH